MPIYEFRCQNCGKIFEYLVRDSSRTTCCPDCGSDGVEKLISASYIMKTGSQVPGTTCCGSTERCDASPCSVDGGCHRDRRR
jgi:putative FmdB family regulatory protein